MLQTIAMVACLVAVAGCAQAGVVGQAPTTPQTQDELCLLLRVQVAPRAA